ncbi:MAG: tetratricopeptide repeat protein [Acidiferrobacterales bacterium]
MNSASKDSGGAGNAPARKKKGEDGDDREIGQIASGQRLLILSITGSYVFANISKDINFAWAIFFLLAVFAMTTTGWLRLAKGLRLSPSSRTFLLLACYLPVVNLVVLVVVNRRANRRLRDAGYKVGLFGAGAAIPPSRDMRNILVGALALTLPVYGLQQEIKYEYHKHALSTAQSGPDPAGARLKEAEQDYFNGKTTAAREALTSLAQAGNATAMQRLGILYMWGLGGNRDNFIDSDAASISRDHMQGMSWLRKAAALGNTEAQVSLGAVYELGLGEERDYSAAADWYRQAAQNNDCVGQVSLAWLYGSGQGVPKDFTIAYMLLDLAQRRYEASRKCFGEYTWLLKGTAGPYPFTTPAIQGDKNNLINKRLGHSGFDAAGDLRNLIVLMAPADVARGKALAAAWKPGDPLR